MLQQQPIDQLVRAARSRQTLPPVRDCAVMPQWYLAYHSALLPLYEPLCDAYVPALDTLAGRFQGVAPGSCSNSQDLCRDDATASLAADEVMSCEVPLPVTSTDRHHNVLHDKRHQLSQFSTGF